MDNAFAKRVQSNVGTADLFLPNAQLAKLCQRCHNLDFWVGSFSLVDTDNNSAKQANECELCKMLSDACADSEVDRGGHVQLERKSSDLKLVGVELPMFSILESPDMFDE